MESTKGLVIRFFMGAYALCDGKCPAGVKPEKDEIYIGTLIKMFDTWDEADAMRKVIDAAYGVNAAPATGSITPLRKVISCAGAHAWIALYDQTFTSMTQIEAELASNAYETVRACNEAHSVRVYKDGALVAEIA